MTFKPISDERILHVWVAKDGSTVEVPPTYYQESGTPQEEDGDDMAYHNTMINYEDGPAVDLVREALRISDMFPTPENQAELDNWLKNMPNEMPTGISMMVGFNYAVNQVLTMLNHPDPLSLREEMLAATAAYKETRNG